MRRRSLHHQRRSRTSTVACRQMRDLFLLLSWSRAGLTNPSGDHETDVEKWLIDRHRSEKSVPQATVVGSFT